MEYYFEIFENKPKIKNEGGIIIPDE